MEWVKVSPGLIRQEEKCCLFGGGLHPLGLEGVGHAVGHKNSRRAIQWVIRIDMAAGNYKRREVLQ